jgi:hypothetical protein
MLKPMKKFIAAAVFAAAHWQRPHAQAILGSTRRASELLSFVLERSAIP